MITANSALPGGSLSPYWFMATQSVCTSRGVDSMCTPSLTKHVPLVGHAEDTSTKKTVVRTSVAEPYPTEFCAYRDD